MLVTAFVPSFLTQHKTTRAGLFGSLAYLEDDNFAKIIKGNNKKAVLVDVCATWCGPCRLIEPFVEHCAEKYAYDLDVVKFDVGSKNAKNVKMELLLQGVMPKALPSLILFNAQEGGKPIATHTGVLKQEQLEAFLESNLAKIKQTATTTTKVQAAVRSIKKPIEASSKKKSGFIGFAMDRDDYALGMLS